jgi:2-polyprenyl-3-methyl-5-hydroxy-6-metoxy-1,4-benzoquinol methylase
MGLASFPSADPAGLETLELFAHADHFNRWMYDAIAPYCQGEILEIGSGIGNISLYLLEKNRPVALSDLRKDYCEILKRRFASFQNLHGVYSLDLSAADPAADLPELYGRYDTVIALNVVEHIGDDGLAIRNCRRLLKPGGRLVILVPASQFLYNDLDRELGHYRRYSKKKAKLLLQREGMELLNAEYFNSAGIFGWWFAGSLQKRKIISRGQLSLYNQLIPLFRLVDKLVAPIAGLSVIVVGKKNDENNDPK